MKEKKFSFKKLFEGAGNPFKGRSFKRGGFSVILIVIVLALAVGINMIVEELPTTVTKLDASTQGVYSISAESKELAASLEDDVTLYLIAESDGENSTIFEMLKRYEAAGSHIKVETKDPVLYPGFVSQYTDAQLPSNSVIAVCGDQSRAVDYNDIFVADYTNYYTTGSMSYSYNGEAAITSAISYVTTAVHPTLYALSGHGEYELSETYKGYIEKQNITVQTLSLLTEDAVPDDANAVLIYSPTGDISAEEAEKLKTYLEGGGSLLLLTDHTDGELTNLLSVTESYGATKGSGIVFDDDPNHFYSNYAYLVPEKQYHSVTANTIDSDLYTLAPMAQSISIAEKYRSTLTVTPLLMTSDSAYEKTYEAATQSIEKEDGDTTGAFCIGAAMEESYNGADTRIVWYACGALMDENVDQPVSGGNSTLILDSLSWLCGDEESAGTSIASISLEGTRITMTSGQKLLWIALMVAIVPLAILVYGFVHWLKRRKR